LCCAGLCVSSTAMAAEEGLPHPQTWLDWLASVKVAGHPLIRGAGAMAFAWALVAALLLTAISVVGTRRLSMRPRGLQTLLEMVVGGLRSIVVSVMGPRGTEFVPFIGALFIYIAVMNLMSLVPGFMAPTSNLSITAGLALVVFAVVQYCGVRERGLGYAKHFVEGVPLQFPYILLAPLVFAVHLVGEVFRPVTLALRLFGNLMAEETVVLILIGLAVPLLLRWWLPLPAQLPNMLLGMLVSLVQAAIFSMLTAVYLAGVLHEPEEAAG
jgi:F-type H+-transporting ATPase subunit a